MWTYLLLNLLFFVTIVLYWPNKWRRMAGAIGLTLVILVALTAVFDPLIIALDIVAYDNSKLLGLFWFGAPVEDFFYALYAAIIVPFIWERLEEKYT